MSTIAVKKVKLGDNADTSKNFLIEVPAVADGTLTIKRENGTSVLSIDATGKAVIPGVVGTVAQAGGIPTGQVVERGSNANGEYVRFADGTQICTRNVSLGATTVSAQGNVFIDPTNRTWTFPAGFSSVPTASVSGVDATNQFTWGTLASLSSTAVAWRLYCPFSGSPQLAGALVAIGRWF